MGSERIWSDSTAATYRQGESQTLSEVRVVARAPTPSDAGGHLHLGGDAVAQCFDAGLGAVAQTVNLSSDKVQPVSEILTFLEAGDPVMGQWLVRLTAQPYGQTCSCNRDFLTSCPLK